MTAWKLTERGLVGGDTRPSWRPIVRVTKLSRRQLDVYAPMDLLPAAIGWRGIVNAVARERAIPASMIVSGCQLHAVVKARAECCNRIRAEIRINGRPPSWYRLSRWFNKNDVTLMQNARKHAPE